MFGIRLIKMNIRKAFEYTLVLTICALIVIPNNVYAKTIDTVGEYKADKMNLEDERILNEYVISGDNGILYFDVEKAIENGETDEVVEIGNLFNEFSADMNTENDNSDMLRGIPVWGNCCGPGYGSGEPIDLLDEGCRQHDNCYVHGGNNCKCNRKLINYINKNIGKMTGGQKRVAKAVKLYFQAENRVKGC